MNKLAVDFGILEDEDITGQQHLFFVQPPMEYTKAAFVDGQLVEVIEQTNWVVSSATWVDAYVAAGTMGEAETFLFPSTKEGAILDWEELEGSVKDAWDCNLPLLNLNYQITRKVEKEELHTLKLRKIPTP